MENGSSISALFSKYLEGSCSPEEVEELVGYFGIEDNRDMLINCILTAMNQDETPDVKLVSAGAAITDRVEATLAEEIRKDPVKLATGKPQRWYWAAAAIFIVGLTTSLYFFLFRNPAPESIKTAQADILPGYNQATLTLTDGTKVELDSAQTGIIVNDENIKYSNGNNVLAEKGEGPSGSGESIVNRKSKIINNILSTPKGGQYQIILSDGTKVWLNAASTLKYPSKFTEDRREVELEGEAYFSVNNKPSAGDRVPYAGSRVSRGPFIVKSRNQSVTVLGTEFNLSAYADDSSVKTTLVNGAVLVAREGEKGTNMPLLLSPGEQSLVKENNLTKTKVDVETAIAWKNGLFIFRKTDLIQVMRQLSRWYAIDVDYQTAPKGKTIWGTISRKDNIGKVLEILTATRVARFSLEGRAVVVRNYE